jgi:putative phosphoserine phosphatase/1-acylglycerol-3-phosphate O-acyltransferase
MDKILQDPHFRQRVDRLSSQLGDSYESVFNEATKCLKEIYTHHQPVMNILGFEVSQFILSRAYKKTIDVNQSQLKEVTKLARRYPIAFVMTHKTYLDMFVLAVVLGRHGIPLPYTFAGLNMDFVGFGQLARQNGVIFIRRTFKEDTIYKAVLKYFIEFLVSERSHFMWSIEGTRSRTGKLVWPKLGILKYISEAEEETKQEVKYIPVSIVYDLIPDVKEMVLEGRGKVKNQESLLWFLNYIKNMDRNMGKVSIRFGKPVPINAENSVAIIVKGNHASSFSGDLSKFGLELVHNINQITPVTTTSLICISLLSKYSQHKQAIENDVVDLMGLIEQYEPSAIVDRGEPISKSVQTALNLLQREGLILQHGDTLEARYVLNSENYIQAVYYANMSVHHLYRLAFIELALLKTNDVKPAEREEAFWIENMRLRSLFKFEFFYSKKATFSDEIERNLSFLRKNWRRLIKSSKSQKIAFFNKQKVIVAPVVLYTYIEAYRVVAFALQQWDPMRRFNEKEFVESCMFLSEELHWQGRIHRIKSVSKAFVSNGLRLIQNLDLIPTEENPKTNEIQAFLDRLNDVERRIKWLQGVIVDKPVLETTIVPIQKELAPGSKTDEIARDILKGPSGPHVAAFFDLDRTLIQSFSASEFLQARIFSGKMTRSEIVSQFSAVIVYAMGQGNFAGLAAIGAQGVKGIEEKVFIELGEETYYKHLADEIYPESRDLVNAHLSKGHTVAIISAATPYQVYPIARDLDIKHVLCTRLETENGKFTGRIIEPACWGIGKTHAALEIKEKFDIDLDQSYFYTDSISDSPLLEIVGNPRPTNPDTKLSALAFKRNWPVFRFNEDERSGVLDFVRTGLAMGSLFPAVASGVLKGASALSWKDGVNSLMASFGDFVVAAAGIELVVKGEHHLWSKRPAVFLFNHQSSADIFIVSKLIRRDATGIAKQELKTMPIIGQIMMAAGVIFIDRGNREKAIEAMKPAVDALKNGTSVIIFPEGTRSRDYKLGDFKKGAFHLAMEAGVPVVPVVIRNAHDAMPRGTNVFRSVAIEVIVYPPMSTRRWKKENLNKNITKIRRIFLKELGQEILTDPKKNGRAKIRKKRASKS